MREKDPICGMSVDTGSAIRVIKGGKEYFFCSTHCRDAFLQQEGSEGAVVSGSASTRPFFTNRLFIISCAALLLLLASVVFPLFLPFRITFFGYVKAVWWAVLLGLVIGGLIDYYIPREYISRVLSEKRPGTIVNAVFLGFLMSACSHGILALSIQLHKKGASNPAVVSFLLASPWANFTITVMLVGLFGIKGVFIILAAIFVAINTGLVFLLLEKKGLIEKNKFSIVVPGHFSVIKDARQRMQGLRVSKKTVLDGLRGVTRGALALSDMVLWWIILGVLIASLASAFIPVHIFHRFMGPTFLGLLVTLLLATVIEVCSEGSSPLAFEIYRQTGALGNSFVFLMAGVATDYTEIGLLWSNVGRRVALWLPLVTVPQVVAIGVLANLLLK